MSRRTHTIKIRRDFADDILIGRKRFEIRENDRGYQTGDYVIFKVIDNQGTSRAEHALNNKKFQITYILSGWGLNNGYVAFGIKERQQ